MEAPPSAPRPPAPPEATAHRELLGGPFWRRIPKYRDVDEATFLDHLWQGRNSVKSVDELIETLGPLVPSAFYDDVREGFRRAPMAARISPYLIAAIDWSRPYDDPIRMQFLPLASRLRPDHPRLTLDSLHERADSPVPGLTHRYGDKALFLPVDVCPVYCRFCTRSYAIGGETDAVESKAALAKTPKAWQDAFAYLASRPEIEDVVVSGGDAYQLSARSIATIGDALLAIPHIRRLRFATKGPAVMPMKILTDRAWTDALAGVVERGRRAGKDVVLHTHVNHPNEITEITARAFRELFARGITVRNQSVLLHGVNDDAETMTLLVKRLGWLNVHPYYVYLHDLVRGVEDLRTTVQTAIDLEKAVRGATSGFNTPSFVCDAPGGGGKREVHSFDLYDRENGIAVYSAPSVKPGRRFTYVDPIAELSPAAQARWRDPRLADAMVADALRRAACAQLRAVSA